MAEKIWISRGTKDDARFLAAIDKATLGEDVFEERMKYWRQHEFTKPPEAANVIIARIGSLYAGYIALLSEDAFEQRIQPRFLQSDVPSLLLEHSGLEFPKSSTTEGMASV